MSSASSMTAFRSLYLSLMKLPQIVDVKTLLSTSFVWHLDLIVHFANTMGNTVRFCHNKNFPTKFGPIVLFQYKIYGPGPKNFVPSSENFGPRSKFFHKKGPTLKNSDHHEY